MNVLLSTAQNTIAMGLNSHMAYLTLNPSYLLPKTKPN